MITLPSVEASAVAAVATVAAVTIEDDDDGVDGDNNDVGDDDGIIVAPNDFCRNGVEMHS